MYSRIERGTLQGHAVHQESVKGRFGYGKLGDVVLQDRLGVEASPLAYLRDAGHAPGSGSGAAAFRAHHDLGCAGFQRKLLVLLRRGFLQEFLRVRLRKVESTTGGDAAALVILLGLVAQLLHVGFAGRVLAAGVAAVQVLRGQVIAALRGVLYMVIF